MLILPAHLDGKEMRKCDIGDLFNELTSTEYIMAKKDISKRKSMDIRREV